MKYNYLYLLLNISFLICNKNICGGNFTIEIDFYIEKPALLVLNKLSSERVRNFYDAKEYFNDIISAINLQIKDTGVKIVPNYTNLESPLEDKWNYECSEPSPIISRTLVANRYLSTIKKLTNIIYIFFCPDLYLNDFQKIAYKKVGECGNFVGILYTTVDETFRNRVTEAITSILFQGLYHNEGINLDLERNLCQYVRMCIEEDLIDIN